jgi:hypothetical protein
MVAAYGDYGGINEARRESIPGAWPGQDGSIRKDQLIWGVGRVGYQTEDTKTVVLYYSYRLIFAQDDLLRRFYATSQIE